MSLRFIVRTACFIGLAALALSVTPLAHATVGGTNPWVGDGAKYGTRDPNYCPSTMAPKHGAITAALVERYVDCQWETDNDGTLMLMGNVKFQVGRGETFLAAGMPQGADSHSLIYPIRGSYITYTCGKVAPYWHNAGHNCLETIVTHATGICYRTAFGDWQCQFGSGPGTIERNNQPPPPKS